MKGLFFILISYCFGVLFGRHVSHVPREQLVWDEKKLDNPEIPICRSETCFKAARNFRESVNASVDPCSDFYAFACGKWIQNNPAPVTLSHWNKFDMLNEEANNQLHELISEPNLFDDSEAVEKVKIVYRACMNQEPMEERGIFPLKRLLDYFGGWPMAGWNMTKAPWYEFMAEPMLLLNVEPIFEVGVSADKKDTTRNIIRISEPSFGVPQYVLTDPNANLNPYKKYIVQSAALLSEEYGHRLPREALEMESDALIRFEVRLAQIAQKQETIRDQEKQHHTVTIRRLQELTDTVPVLNKDLRINWKRFLSLITKHVMRFTPFTDETQVSIAGLNFIYEILMLIDATPQRVVANYIQWRVVMTMSPHLNLMMRSIRADFSRHQSGVADEVPRWKECVEYAGYLRFGLGYMYVKNHFSLHGKEKAISMVSEIRDAFRQELTEISWMDDATKEAALEKADFVLLMIGYPHWFSNVSNVDDYYRRLFVDHQHFENIIGIRQFIVDKQLRKLLTTKDRGEWITEPITANAYYDPEQNTIMFPAGILRPPFFSVQQPECLNYGGIGAIIGHEISHAFDDTGRQRDKLGNVRQWWSKETEKTYVGKSQCFIEQYQQYRVPELDSYLKKAVTVNGLLTLAENIADNGGLRAAYRAYKANILRKGGPEPRLPGLEHITAEQLFFLSFSTVWCESTTRTALLSEVLGDPHSPHRYRVLGTLSNSPEFAEAWQCPEGSPMNPSKKCQLW